MTEKPQVIFHIGTHKTGSTALQEALAANRSALRRHGLRYLRAGRHLAGHHRLAWAAKGTLRDRLGENPDRVLDSAARELERLGGETAVVSSEVFENFSLEDVRAIKKRLGISCARIVLYLRPQYEALLARYKERVKTPRTRYSKAFVEFAFRKQVLRNLDYLSIADAWAESFGDDSIVLRVYAPERLRGGGTIADFLSVLGFRPDERGLVGRYADHRANPSPSNLATEALRILNRYPLSERNHLKAWRLLAEEADTHDSAGSLATPEQWRAIWEWFYEPNRKLAERFDVDLTPLLTPPPGFEEGAGGGEVVDREEVAVVLASVVSRLLGIGGFLIRARSSGEMLRAIRRRADMSVGRLRRMLP